MSPAACSASTPSPHRTCRIFSRATRRVLTLFDTAFGEVAAGSWSGALNVGSMATVWGGRHHGPLRAGVMTRLALRRDVSLEKGEELGRFKHGLHRHFVCSSGNRARWLGEVRGRRNRQTGPIVRVAAVTWRPTATNASLRAACGNAGWPRANSSGLAACLEGRDGRH